MKLLNEIEKLIGNTPTVNIRYCRDDGVSGLVVAKMEWYNLTGSIKDRAAYYIIKDAYESGLIKPGYTLVEATSGNMGLSLCVIGKQLGYKVKLFMPKTMSEERFKIFELLGADVEKTNSLTEAVERAKEYAAYHKDAYWTDQFNNFSNVRAHMLTTGFEISEIYDKIKKDNPFATYAFVAGMGSCGTMIGVSKVLPMNIKRVVAEPANTPIFSVGPEKKGAHAIQGLSNSVISKNFKKEDVDIFVPVSDDDVIAMAKKLNNAGYSVGLSGAANFLAAVLYGANISFTVFPDDHKKYLSTQLTQPVGTFLVDGIEIE